MHATIAARTPGACLALLLVTFSPPSITPARNCRPPPAIPLNETSGLRVQATIPSLGGANVRAPGLRGRYSLVLADGLPRYGGQAGRLGLLQIPPVDLARVEVIKGTASERCDFPTGEEGVIFA